MPHKFGFEAKNYPTEPGCYLMKDGNGTVIYVGKAKNLRRRLSSYFSATAHGKARRVAAKVRDIEVFIVNNETESLILENNLIKRHKPAYNVLLTRDNSGYAYIMLTGERFPRCVIYRKNRVNKTLDGIEEINPPRRFGPYVSRRFRDALLDFVNEYYGLRVCKPMPRKTCLRYQIGKCSGICEALVTEAEYARAVRGAIALLSYHHADDLIAQLKQRMLDHADQLEFEKARKLRDQIQALEATLEKQIVDRDVPYDQDVVYFGVNKVMVAHVEAGAVREASLFDLDTPTGAATDDEHACYEQACVNFLLAYYCQSSQRTMQDKELIINHLDDPKAAAETLRQSCGQHIKITVPKRGTKRDLLRLCEQNLALNNTLTVRKLG